MCACCAEYNARWTAQKREYSGRTPQHRAQTITYNKHSTLAAQDVAHRQIYIVQQKLQRQQHIHHPVQLEYILFLHTFVSDANNTNQRGVWSVSRMYINFIHFRRLAVILTIAIAVGGGSLKKSQHSTCQFACVDESRKSSLSLCASCLLRCCARKVTYATRLVWSLGFSACDRYTDLSSSICLYGWAIAIGRFQVSS